MEENIKDSISPDVNETMKAIDSKKRILATRIINNPPEIADDAMEKHVKTNTLNGIYPWTEGEEEVFDETKI